MANQENKGKAETFILRGNAESVMRQLVDEYNSSNGWSVNPYRDWETDRKSTRLNSSHSAKSRMPSSA